MIRLNDIFHIIGHNLASWQLPLLQLARLRDPEFNAFSLEIAGATLLAYVVASEKKSIMEIINNWGSVDHERVKPCESNNITKGRKKIS